ncbi:CHAT domain-containing protein [Picosynechococcus sp. PCC 7117]|uniref:CHAT domain-containing protein n=1 Tax=Picosynechococcus sp. PCC 7117 TaxID=195498 RepID=UPI000AAD5ED8|nr:CHAT domain-containing tetratricopeptide repeat protein [Picosynechococcus sp. PCC 7117]
MMSKTEYEQNLDANLNEWTIDELSEYLEENCEEAELELIFRAIELLQDVLQNSFEFESEIHLNQALLRLSQKNIHDLFQFIFNDLEPPTETLEEIEAAVAMELPDVDVESVQQWLMFKIAVVFEMLRMPLILQEFEAGKIKSPEDWAEIQWDIAYDYFDNLEQNRREITERVIHHYQEALTVWTKDSYPEDWATTQNVLALAYLDRIEGERRENIELAIFHCQQALTVRTKEAYPEAWAATQNNLASAYRKRIEGERRENLELAIFHYQQALTIDTKETYPEYWATTQNNLALAYLDRIEGERRENLELAIFHYQEALTVSTEEAYPEDWATTQNNLASAYSDRIEGDRRENLERAIFHYQQALTVRTKNDYPHECLNTSSGLGDLYFQQANWQEAIKAYQTAIECIELLTSWATDDDYKQQIITENIEVYDNIIQACVALGKYDEAITYAERGRSRRLVDLIASNDLYADAEIPPEIQDYLARYEAIEKQLHDLRQEDDSQGSMERRFSRFQETNLSSEAREEKLEQIQALAAEKQTLWREIRRADPVIAQQIQVEAISFAEIAALLPGPESAILSICNTGAETHIFVIRYPAATPKKSGLFSRFQQPKQAKPIVTLHSCLELTYGKLEELLTEQWLIPYQENNPQWRANLGHNLQNIAQALNLEQLVQDHLQGIKELIIIPHLGLHHIPFAALPLGDAQATVTSNSPDNSRIKLKEKTKITKIQSIIHKTYLGDQFQIRVLPSCQILKYCHDRPQPQKITYGIVENASDDLKFTHIEAQRLRELETVLPENYLRGKAEVTVKNYQALLERVENIHSAHHAESNLSNPRESALKLGDGNFSLGSLMLKRYPNLNHVFLSCCETNLGKPELTDDLLTLGTGFLCAGARTVISSLWAVDDLATAIFTSYYYEVLKETQKPAIALQQAQQRLRNVTIADLCRDFPELAHQINIGNPNQQPYIDPFYWAGFICQGS